SESPRFRFQPPERLQVVPALLLAQRFRLLQPCLLLRGQESGFAGILAQRGFRQFQRLIQTAFSDERSDLLRRLADGVGAQLRLACFFLTLRLEFTSEQRVTRILL